MSSTRAARRISAWIAIFAMLAAALAPAVSHAKFAASPPLLVCSVHDGTAPSAPDPSRFPDDPAAFQHCPYCGSHAGSFGLAPSLGVAFAVRTAAPAPAAAIAAVPRARPLASAARPRAPPLPA